MTFIRFTPHTAENQACTQPGELLRDFMGLRFPFFPAQSTGGSDWTPPVDVYEDKDSFTVTLEAPGLRKEDFAISWHDGVLSISGERKDENTDAAKLCFRQERFYGRFSRSVSMPADVQPDKITAAYKDGVLTAVLPKADEAKPKQIEVSVN